ncbi:MAG: type IV toxin-antitoxin system AbiEi family antitoxin domain-containing protein, partial [Candidatus Aminicenantes bacterium]
KMWKCINKKFPQSVDSFLRSMYYIDMEKETVKEKIVEFMRNNGGYARMKDFKAKSFRTSKIKKLVDDGTLDKIKPGLYRIADLEYPGDISISFVDVSKAIPGGVICLISALSYYELTTFNPSKIYVAIPNKKHSPGIIYPPVEIFYFRERFYKPGIETIETDYGDVMIYNREKTICDIFRYRNKLGEDIALEALKAYISYKHADLYKLKEYAEVCQVKNVLLPYLKALVG